MILTGTVSTCVLRNVRRPRSAIDAAAAGRPLAGPSADIDSVDHGQSVARNHHNPRLRRRCSVSATAMSEGRAHGEVDTPPRVLGLGSAGVDFIASVDRYVCTIYTAVYQSRVTTDFHRNGWDGSRTAVRHVGRILWRVSDCRGLEPYALPKKNSIFFCMPCHRNTKLFPPFSVFFFCGYLPIVLATRPPPWAKPAPAYTQFYDRRTLNVHTSTTNVAGFGCS